MFSSFFLLPIWLGVSLMATTAQCALKKWVHNMNYDNAQNWLDNKVPDLGSDLIYPLNLYALTTLPNEVGNLDLPRNGGFLLAANGEIVVRESTNKRSFFRIPQKKPWLLSNNWRLINSETNKAQDYNAAIPHQEMIPCQTDVAVFDTTFRVDLQYLPKIQARGISLAGDMLNLDEFQAFLSTEMGQLMFLNTDDTIFEANRCGDAATDECVCQASNVLDILCENERNDCATPHCFEPVQPIGHCCPICAGVAQIEYLPSQNVSVAKLKERIDKQVRISGYGPQDVDTHVSIVKDLETKRRWIQLVIVDKQDYRGVSTELVAGLRKSLLQQIYRDSQQKIFLAGHPYQPNHESHGLLMAFATLLCVTVFLTLVHAYYYDNKYITRLSAMMRMRQFFNTPNIFARFENHPDDIGERSESGLAPDETVVVSVEFPVRQQSTEELENSSAFNNPMFEDTLEKGGDVLTDHRAVEDQKSYVNIELLSDQPTEE